MLDDQVFKKSSSGHDTTTSYMYSTPTDDWYLQHKNVVWIEPILGPHPNATQHKNVQQRRYSSPKERLHFKQY